MKTSIYTFEAPHIPAMSEAFNQIGWNKPVSLFTGYLKEQEAGERLVWVAHVQDKFTGYVTLKWQSQYPLFKAQNIPEIMDLNVLPGFRKIGIGSLLLDTAEKAAAMKSSIVGLGVGLYSGYGAAQRLYIKRGYIPDGRGITYDGIYVEPGSVHRVDDNLILWLIKRFQRCSNSNIS